MSAFFAGGDALVDFPVALKHLSAAQVANGIKKGTLIQGTLNVSQHNVLEVMKGALFICWLDLWATNKSSRLLSPVKWMVK